MLHDTVRAERMIALMSEYGLDALICQMPQNVLMLSGYYPVLSESLVILLANGDGAIVTPESEVAFARDSAFGDIRSFNPSTLDYTLSPTATADPLIAEICCEKGIASGIIGVESRAGSMTAPYLEVLSQSCTACTNWAQMMPAAEFVDASELLARAASIKTPHEIERIRIACNLAEYGFETAKEAMETGTREIEVAAAANFAVSTEGTGAAGVRRVGAWAFCMSGPRSAQAGMPYQYSTNRPIELGDAAVVQICCHADGYWANMTRTFFAGEPSLDQARAYDTLLDAWNQAVEAVAPGAKASDVDSAARSVMAENGYGDAFTHGTGHGVGFKAISREEMPVIHPQSSDVLANDMVFTIQPAIYLPNKWGMRICDVVYVRGRESKVVSVMPRDLEWATCTRTG